MTTFQIRYCDERGDEIDTIEVTGADKAAIPLEAQHLFVSVKQPGPEPDDLICCGMPMGYQEFVNVRRYHCSYRSHHEVVYVDQLTGEWERRSG